jgi:2'-5' RNA ligase
MGILKKAVSSFESKPEMLTTEDLGWVKIGEGNSYSSYKEGQNDYENAYPSVTKIINKFMKIRPFTVDKLGNKVDSNVKNVLYHPNRLNSSVEFREALALMYLVHAKTHILVWRREGNMIIPGGDLTKDNIGGFTIMQNPVVVNVKGENQYTVTTAKGTSHYTDREVITLRGLNPYAINTGGYSPTVAAHKWTTIDDYIAQYQAGFFKNGAVPTGEFVITAKTTQDFNDMVDKLQERHRGAGKNNNVTYTHRPIDPNTKKPMDAQIEWIPFATPNRELSLDALFAQANKKIDSSYGVPASIRGVGENNNYATARTDQQNFMENVVDPITLKIWTGFTHELNRITGGLGVSIDYVIDIPALADEELVKEERGKIRDERFITLSDKGYTVESIDEYFETGDIKVLSTTAKPVEADDEDEGNIDDGKEVENAPNPDKAGEKPIAEVPVMQVSSREHPEIYEDLDIDTNDLGCIMLDLEKLSVLDVVGQGASEDLATTVTMDRTPVPGEEATHVTLLYGLLENGNVWKDKVDTLLEGWSMESVTIKDIGYFDLPDSYAIIAHVETSTDLLEGHNRLTLLPHIQTFSDYRPHVTLAYISKEADLGKWLTALNGEYEGIELKVTGINYGDEPDDSDEPEDRGELMPNNTAGKDPDGIYSPKGRFLGKKLPNGLIMLKSPDKEETIVKV